MEGHEREERGRIWGGGGDGGFVIEDKGVGMVVNILGMEHVFKLREE